MEMQSRPSRPITMLCHLATNPVSGVLLMLRNAISLSLLSISVSTARADDAEDKAVRYVVESGGTIKCDEAVNGKPVVEVKLNDLKAIHHA
jgi:hypothetical protein